MSQIDETEINMPLNDSFEDLFKDADQPELVVDERQEVVPVRVERKTVNSCASMEAMPMRASEIEKKNVILTDELLAATKQNQALIDQLAEAEAEAQTLYEAHCRLIRKFNTLKNACNTAHVRADRLVKYCRNYCTNIRCNGNISLQLVHEQ